ncbi:MAG: PLP-dependent aminotransferase family protein [bacterium]|nr:PLP-dependent aminotransferase family protein [Gammaproteobacteria bacterium]HIL97315.1 PLP-dependent aminotransferase family protein [Pseudomonadales bacterium]
MKNLIEIQQMLAGQWSGINSRDLVNDATGSLLNDPGDWDPPRGITPRIKTIPLAIGIPDGASLPKEELSQLASKVITRPGEAAFVYGFGVGYRALRAQLAQKYTADRGLEVNEEWFQLCNGSSGAIDLVCRTLVQPGDVIITEAPTYMGTLRNFKAVQADIRAVPMDKDGLLIPDLEAAIQQALATGKTIKFIYTISTFQNPTGATLSRKRRIELLKLAAKYKILILDDDAYGDLYFDQRPPESLTSLSGGYGVLTVGTFSKTIATGLRIGWIHGHPSLIGLFGKMRFAMGLNQMMVRIISAYIEDGYLEHHGKLVRSIYREKMETLANALDRHAADFIDYDRPQGGFYLWIRLKNGIKAQDLWRTAAEEGVGFTQGINFFPNRVDPEQHIRIAFPWTQLSQMEEAATRFGRACARVSKGDIA